MGFSDKTDPHPEWDRNYPTLSGMFSIFGFVAKITTPLRVVSEAKIIPKKPPIVVQFFDY